MATGWGEEKSQASPAAQSRSGQWVNEDHHRHMPGLLAEGGRHLLSSPMDRWDCKLVQNAFNQVLNICGLQPSNTAKLYLGKRSGFLVSWEWVLYQGNNGRLDRHDDFLRRRWLQGREKEWPLLFVHFIQAPDNQETGAVKWAMISLQWQHFI